MSHMKRAYELEHPEEFLGEPEAKMTQADAVDSAEFELRYARAQDLIAARKLELFKKDPTCRACSEAIDDVEQCELVQLADEAGDYLCHRTARCVRTSTLQMVERYFGRARRPRQIAVAGGE